MSILSIISIIALVVCFCVGFFKGIVKALFKLLTIVGTSLITVFATPYLAKALYSIEAMQKLPAGVVSGISAIAVVIISIIVFSIITHIVNKRVGESSLSGLNRFLGGLFHAFVGFVFLILIGYVINIFRDAEFMQKIILDSQKDVFANWLVTNNLFNKFMEAVAKEGGVFWQFINGFKQIGDSAGSGEAASGATANLIGAIAGIR